MVAKYNLRGVQYTYHLIHFLVFPIILHSRVNNYFTNIAILSIHICFSLHIMLRMDASWVVFTVI